ncbi:hypothetical protein ATCC90586_007806 [Pythium insidiosum]|nr:hypothetical protein ATCC90586_007806 [Pythium insidiosum]
MWNLRRKLVVQTQAAEKESKALCGLYSINNAVQVFNFITQDRMAATLEDMAASRPDEDHGCRNNGHYSIAAFQHTLRKMGMSLVHLNKAPFLFKKSKKEWPRRLVRCTFKKMLIIGKPPNQVEGIYHCIAATTFKDVRYIIDPDDGQRAIMTEESLNAFLPELGAVYAILSTSELEEYKVMSDNIKNRRLKQMEVRRQAKQVRYNTSRQRDVKKNRRVYKK